MHMYGKRRKNGNMSSTFSFVSSMSCGTGRMSYLPPTHIAAADMKQFISAKVYLFSFLYFARLCYIPQSFLDTMSMACSFLLAWGLGSLRLLHQHNIISHLKYTRVWVCRGDVHHLLSQTFKLKLWEGVKRFEFMAYLWAAAY